MRRLPREGAPVTEEETAVALAVQYERERIADALEKIHPGELRGPRASRHWTRFNLNRQARKIREGL